MPKTAFLFPGQGSQFTGMGKTLADNYAAARAIFEEADRTLGFPISKLCFEGPEDQLRLTENTQPALLTVSTAAAAVLAELGIEADFAAGHSLGEYSALVACGGLLFSDALRLVRKRGRYMQEAVPPGVGAMAALLKMPEEKLAEVLALALAGAAPGEVVTAANLNSPDQVVIAGNADAVNRAMELAKAAGAKRAVLLPVSAPFHCALMKPAQARLAADLEASEFRDLRFPLISNYSAQPVTTGAAARRSLFEQIPNPVLWTQSVRWLAAQGVERYLEVGPGAVLSGLLRNIDPALKASKCGEAADVEVLCSSRLSASCSQ